MKPSRRILWALAGAFALVGMLESLRPKMAGPYGPTDVALSAALMAAIYSWCRAEARERGSVAPGRAALWAAIFSPIFLPVYFFRTRRIGAALLSSAKSLGLYVLLSLLQLLGALAISLLRG